MSGADTDFTDFTEFRMLEDPSYDQVVRWGNEGDSFVVLEVTTQHCTYPRILILTNVVERKIHEIHPAQAFQAQQFRQFCPTTEQI